MTNDKSDWQEIAAIIRDALPEIDKALSQANVALSDRKLKAYEIVCDTMLEVSDYEAFFVSPAHGRIHIIIGDWFEARYGAAAENNQNDLFTTLVLIYDCPFEMHVPKNFKTRAEEPNMVWIGFPASVQDEEDPLLWIKNRSVVQGLTPEARSVASDEAKHTANLIRSISFDLRAIRSDSDASISDLAGAVFTDLQASARHLCIQDLSGLRASGWDVSQAVEKALKILIRRNGESPPFTHDLEKLSSIAERTSQIAIDRNELAKIPSNREATGMRYGGEITLAQAISAYQASLPILRNIMFAAKPDSKYNVREARFKIQKPPWFNFDTDAFSAELKKG